MRILGYKKIVLLVFALSLLVLNPAFDARAVDIPSLGQASKPLVQFEKPPSAKSIRERISELMDDPYEVAANYLPALVMRSFTESKLFRKSKKAHVQRYFYRQLAPNKWSVEPFEKMIFDVDVQKTGMFSRKLMIKGKVNDIALDLVTEFKYNFTRKGVVETKSTLGGYSLLDLKVDSNGVLMTNKVLGSLWGNPINYKTQFRTTSGIIAGQPYEMYVKGVHNEPKYSVNSKGKIGNYEITGHGVETEPGLFHLEERYGPLLVKTVVEIIDSNK